MMTTLIPLTSSGTIRKLRKSCQANHSINQDVTKFTESEGGHTQQCWPSHALLVFFEGCHQHGTCQITLLLQLPAGERLKCDTCR